MPKHEQRSHLGIGLGAGVYPLFHIGPMVDKLEEAACLTNTASLLANPTLPGALFSLKVLLLLSVTPNGTNATHDN